MRTSQFLVVLVFLLSVGLGQVMAQPAFEKGKEHGNFKMNRGGMNHGEGIPNLTEEQKTKMKEIRITSFKETKALHNQLGELKARQKTLTTGDNPDIKAINTNIDEITKVQNQLMKMKALKQVQILGLLTDEQKFWLATHAKHKKNRGMKGHHKPSFQD